MIIAHKGDHGEQSLEEHSFNVADYCWQVGCQFDCPHILFLMGLLHDVGKADRKFQDYIRSGKGSVIHSSAGGKAVKVYFADEAAEDAQKAHLDEILEYVIFAHHGFFDVISSDLEDMMAHKMHYDDDPSYHFKEDVLPFLDTLDEKIAERSYPFHSLKEAYGAALTEFHAVDEKICQLAAGDETKQAYYYYYHCFVRLCLSVLKEGDVYDSANALLDVNDQPQRFEEEDIKTIWQDNLASVEQKAAQYAKHKNESRLNRYRTDFSEQLKAKATEKRSGIYRLSLPTGAGKTQASLRFALNHAVAWNKSRIFYVTAFLSVLEQNAKDIKDTLPAHPEAILEHHSNIVNEAITSDPDNENGPAYRDYLETQYLIDSWNAPMILTTMVQFFNTLFKGRSSNIRRFHQLIDSVIILDEVQSLPNKVIYLFNLMANFLSAFMHATIILCTATQPIYDDEHLDYRMQTNGELVRLNDEEKRAFNRVQAINMIDFNGKEWHTTEQLVEFLQTDLAEHNSALVILNTKGAAAELYQAVKDAFPSAEVLYLTTNLYPKHRLRRIGGIREQLAQLNAGESTQRLIVISTQLVEAGVDFDFDVVYRSLAGIDSIVQAAGRCNRNRRLEKGVFRIVRYASEQKALNDSTALRDIRTGQISSQMALKRVGGYAAGIGIDLSNQLKDFYYQNYFSRSKGDLPYPIEKSNDTLFKWLARNQDYCIKDYDPNRLLAQHFRTASETFQLIDADTLPVIVPCEDNESLIEQLETAVDYQDYHTIQQLIKRLQPFTLQVYNENEIQQISRTLLDGKIAILNEENYEEETGLNKELAPLIL